MDSSTWLSTTSLDLDLNLNLNSIRLLDDSPAPNTHHHHENVDDRETETHSFTSGEGEVGSRNNSPRDETSALIEELNRVNAENKRLTEMLKVVCENYNALRRQFDCLSCIPPPATPSSNDHTVDAKKRKSGTGQGSNENNSESSSSEENFISSKKQREETVVKAKITRVYVRTEAADSSLVVKDGYQWRKYGQKVTRDNPSPRAYFKCSFAPSCPVKKKVQRSVEDQTVVVATYEGEHNHPQPCGNQDSPTNNKSNMTAMSIGSMPTPTTLNSTAVPNTVTLDLTKHKPAGAAATPTSAAAATPRINSPEFQSMIVEQMASSLTRDPNFTAAIAAAVSGRFLNQS